MKRRRNHDDIRREERQHIADTMIRMAERLRLGRSRESDVKGLDHKGQVATDVAGILLGIASSIEGGVYASERLWPEAAA